MPNPLTCEGFTDVAGGWIASSACLKSRLGIVLLFFVLSFLRKWGGEEMGLNFSFMFALILGLLPYLIIVLIFGSFKWAFIIGLIGGLVGGYGGGMFFDDSGGGE